MSGEREMLTITQAAKLAGMSVAATRRAASNGALKAQKVGAVWLTQRKHVEAWINNEQSHKPGRKAAP